jgi:hypothetical protein
MLTNLGLENGSRVAVMRGGPAALTSRAPNPVSTAFDDLIRELGLLILP